MQPGDLDRLDDIDATVETTRYLHLDRAGEGLAVSWRLEERPLREKLIAPLPLNDERRFLVRQIARGADEGLALLAEHEGAVVAALVAQPQPGAGVLRVVDVRVDYDFRRQGLGTALVFRAIQHARETGLRAVAAEARTNNFPANQFLAKCGFDLAGVDAQRDSNHDLVKESATLIWYAALD
ncbi:MAG: GNAT family N-acetyltransferase [Tepidisphaeraceae bacterium]